jgi:hypothetical protein
VELAISGLLTEHSSVHGDLLPGETVADGVRQWTCGDIRLDATSYGIVSTPVISLTATACDSKADADISSMRDCLRARHARIVSQVSRDFLAARLNHPALSPLGTQGSHSPGDTQRHCWKRRIEVGNQSDRGTR